MGPCLTEAVGKRGPCSGAPTIRSGENGVSLFQTDCSRSSLFLPDEEERTRRRSRNRNFVPGFNGSKAWSVSKIQSRLRMDGCSVLIWGVWRRFVFASDDGAMQMLNHENVHAFVTTPLGVLVLAGLAHMGLDSGKVFIIPYVVRAPRDVKVLIQLEGAPQASRWFPIA
jgi:hypothetical protein